VRKLFPACIDIFILPPSLQSLEQRLIGRGTDSQEVIDRRLAAAHEDLSHAGEFEYVIINDQFSDAVEDLVAVVRSGRCRRQQQFLRRPQILSTLDE
jgi:guanylate kinase